MPSLTMLLSQFSSRFLQNLAAPGFCFSQIFRFLWWCLDILVFTRLHTTELPRFSFDLVFIVVTKVRSLCTGCGCGRPKAESIHFYAFSHKQIDPYLSVNFTSICLTSTSLLTALSPFYSNLIFGLFRTRRDCLILVQRCVLSLPFSWMRTAEG
jgi:hypothetical protein